MLVFKEHASLDSKCQDLAGPSTGRSRLMPLWRLVVVCSHLVNTPFCRLPSCWMSNHSCLSLIFISSFKVLKENTKLHGSLAPYRKWISSLPIPNPPEVYGAQLFTSCYSGVYLLNNMHVWWIGEAVCLRFDQALYCCCIALY